MSSPAKQYQCGTCNLSLQLESNEKQSVTCEKIKDTRFCEEACFDCEVDKKNYEVDYRVRFCSKECFDSYKQLKDLYCHENFDDIMDTFLLDRFEGIRKCLNNMLHGNESNIIIEAILPIIHKKSWRNNGKE